MKITLGKFLILWIAATVFVFGLSNIFGIEWSAMVFTCLTIFIILFVYLNISRQIRLSKALNQECDPYKFLEEVAKIRKYYTAKNYQAVYDINEAAGLVWIKRADEAIRILEAVDIKVLNKNARIVYESNLLAAYLSAGRLEQAKLACERIMAAGVPKNNSVKTTIDYNLLYADCMKFNPTDDNIHRFLSYGKDLLAKAASLKLSRLMLVTINYAIGKAYIELNQPGSAREYMEFVAENGNRLHIVEDARSYLDEN